MNNHRHGAQDWAIPAVLVATALGLLLVVGLAFAVSTEQRAQAPPLVVDLATYTDCLIDHGADLPSVVVDRDGGFSVIVPGSLVVGEVDPESWAVAADECVNVAPDLLGGLVGGLFGGWLHGGPVQLFDDVRAIHTSPGAEEMSARADDSVNLTPGPGNPEPNRGSRGRDAVRARCERVETAGDAVTGPRIECLRRHCGRLGR